MKKILLMAGVAAFAFASSASALEVSPYVSAKLSYDWAKNDAIWGRSGGNDLKRKLHKNTWGGHYAAGAISGPVRAEIEWNHYKDVKRKIPQLNKKIRLQNNILLLNAYYDINTCTPWTPYVGAGMGVAMLKYTEKATDSNYKGNWKAYNFAWQIGAGVTYELTRNIALDGGYRYINAGAADNHRTSAGDAYEKVKIDTAAHEIYLGARYTF